MGLFSKLFGRKNEDKSASELMRSAVSDKTSADLKMYQETVDHIVVSESLESDLKLKLKQAFADPRSFYDDDNEFILSERGLTYPDNVALTPKFVLIDTMEDEDQMAEVDWKEDEDEIRFAINRIMKAKNYPTISDEVKYADLDTSEIIKKINDDELKPMGHFLEILDINSDSYVFTIIPIDKHQDVSELFLKLK